MSDDQTPAAEQRPGSTTAPESLDANKRRVRRRLLVKAAVATGAAVVGASGAYVQPSVRPIQIPTVHAFSF